MGPTAFKNKVKNYHEYDQHHITCSQLRATQGGATPGIHDCENCVKALTKLALAAVMVMCS